MKKQSKIFVLGMLLAICMLVGACSSLQVAKLPVPPKYPDRPITLIVPFSAGGGIDLVARAMEKVAPKYLGQALIVVNKPGGTGSIGWNELVTANPDGYTIGISSIELLLNPLYGATKYNYPTALEPLAQVANSPSMMVVLADQPWQNVASLIDYGKQHPGQLKFSHPGIGSLSHIIGEEFSRMTDSGLVQVPFRGGGESIAALLGGHVQIAFVSPALVKEHVKSGKVKALAVLSERHLDDPVFAQVATFKEQNINIAVNNWFGVAAPKELPVEIKNKLGEAFKLTIADEEFRTLIENMGVQVEYLNPSQSASQWKSDSQKLNKTIKETGILDLIKAQKQ